MRLTDAEFARLRDEIVTADVFTAAKTTEDILQKQLHAYTITHAIEDGNVLRFHIDYLKPVVPASGSHAPAFSFPRSCVGMQTALAGYRRMGSHAGAWEPDVFEVKWS